MVIELRSGFCDPYGELLGVAERPAWRRVTGGRRREVVDELVRVCEERRAVGGPRRGCSGRAVHRATSSATGIRRISRATRRDKFDLCVLTAVRLPELDAHGWCGRGWS